jgi:hypothetical protein
VRGNGLTAAAYVAVADLDAQLADTLLQALGERGVAAYAAPTPDLDPQAADLPGGVDRLYVDAEAEAEARALLDELASRGPAADDARSADPLDSLDFDAAFSQIVAGFDTLVQPARPAEPPLSGPAGPPRPATAIGWEDLLRPQPAPAPDPEERYVPPPPPPLPRVDVSTRIAWVAALFGPILLFVAVLVNWQLPDALQLLAAVSFLAGFVALVAKLRTERDDDDDDGAVV